MTNVEVESQQVIDALNKIVQQFPELLKEALNTVGHSIEANAKTNLTAVRTGALRRSITTVLDDDGLGVKVGTNVAYAPYVHEGTGLFARNGNGRQEVPWTYRSEEDGKFYKTSGIKPNPFLEDAVNRLSSDILSYFEGILEKGNKS